MKPKCDQIQALLPAMIDRTCSEQELALIQEHLQFCPACVKQTEEFRLLLHTLDAIPEEEPSQSLRTQFKLMLESQLNQERDTRTKAQSPHRREAGTRLHFILTPWFQAAAAACLLFVGGLSGHLLTYRSMAEKAAAKGEETNRELIGLRAQLDSMTLALVDSLKHQQEPEGNRLRRVSMQASAPFKDASKLAALLNTLSLDPSTNVRLSALEALYPYADQFIVQEGVTNLLPREHAPLVQLAMIDFLSTLGDPKANTAIQTLAKDPAVDAQVRNAAARALAVCL